MRPSIGKTSVVEITCISQTGNAHVKISDKKHLNIGCIDCSVGDSVEVRRLDKKYCICLDSTLRPDNYLFRLSRMRQHDDEVNSDKYKIENNTDEIVTETHRSKKDKNPFGGSGENKNSLINGSL